MKCTIKPWHELEAGQKAGVSSRGSPSRAAPHVSEYTLAKLHQIG